MIEQELDGKQIQIKNSSKVNDEVYINEMVKALKN